MISVLVGSTQAIKSFPRINRGGGTGRRAPSSCTVKVTTPAVVGSAYVSATVSSYSATITTPAVEGDDTLDVSASTGFVDGDSYLLDAEGPDGIELEARAKTYLAAATAQLDYVLDSALTGADLEGVYVTLTNAAGAEEDFEFDTGGGVVAGRVAVAVLAGDDAATCLAALAVATASSLGITIDGSVVTGGGTSTLTLNQSAAGAAGNTAAYENGVPFVVSFTGGVTANTVPTTLQLAEPIPRAADDNAPIVGWACSVALSAEQTESAGYGIARWKAVIGGETFEWDESFRVVHRMLRPTLTPTRLTQAYPVVAQLRPKKDGDLEETLRLAWEYNVRAWLELAGYLEEYVINVEALEPLHALACVLRLARPNPAFPRETLESLEREWTQLLQSTQARVSWYAAPPGDTPQPSPETGTPEISFMLVTR